MCVEGMSISVVDTCRYLRAATQQRRSVLVPALAIPQLQAISRADYDDLPGQARVLAQEAWDHDASGSIQVGVVGAAVEEALELRQARGERRQLSQRALAVALVVLGPPDAHARLEVHRHRQNHPFGQCRAVASRNREAVLGVKRVVEGPAESHCRRLLS